MKALKGLAIWLVVGLVFSYFWVKTVPEGFRIFAEGAFWGICLSVLVIGVLIHKFCEPLQRKHPYSWTCTYDDCDFTVKTTDMDLADRVINHHKEETHNEWT